MRYSGIILTGTKASGKTALARRLSGLDGDFSQVPAFTTRSERPDDLPGEYEYVSENEFQRLRDANEFFVYTEYHGNHYGICEHSLLDIEEQGKVPIMILTPECASRIENIENWGGRVKSVSDRRFFSIFLDASDDELDNRFEENRGNGELQPTEIHEQRAKDREFKYRFLYTIRNTNLASTLELVLALWDYSGVGGVLSARLIRLMLDCNLLLGNANKDNVEGASYDLRLGDEYYYGGEIKQLSENRPILLIEPYDYAIVTSRERARLPRDICARFDLSVGLFSSGLILSNGPQMDPGFQGPLFCLLFNTSSSPVVLKRGQHYATLEFKKLLEPTHIYQGPYQEKTLIHYLPASASRGAINVLKKELEQVRSQSQLVQNIALGVMSIILALVAMLVATR